MPQYSSEYGMNPDFFGHKDYWEAKRTGASDADILEFLDSNPGVLRFGNVAGAGGLYDEVKASAKSESDKYQGQIDTAKGEAATYKGERDRYAERMGEYDQTISGLRDQITGYNTQIGGLQSDIEGYRGRVKDLTGQYNEALETSQANALARDEFQRQFQDATALYEQEKATADRYREEAIGQQLRAVRAGQTAGAGTQSDQLRGTLASGRTGFSSSEKDISELAESMRSQGGLTDSVLSREGPVVQQLSAGQRGGSGGQRQMRSSAGSGSYYASRFR